MKKTIVIILVVFCIVYALNQGAWQTGGLNQGAWQEETSGEECALPVFHDTALICTAGVAVSFTFKSDSTDSIVNQSAFPSGLTLNKTTFGLTGTPTTANAKDSIVMLSYNCDGDSIDTGYANVTTVWGNVYLDSVAPDSGSYLDTITVYGIRSRVWVNARSIYNSNGR